MSHQIETRNHKAQIAYAGETPWHGLGVKVPHDLTPQQILESAGLDWKVVPRPLYFEIDKKRHRVGHRALVRDVDQKVLTVITKAWNPVQNDEAFAFFHDIVMAGNMQMDTAGSLYGGRKVWALARVSDSFTLKIGGKETQDVVDGYLLLTNPHEYGQSIDARFTAVRVVCNNTLSMAMGSKSCHSVSMNHRRPFDAEKLKEMMGIAHLSMEGYKEAAEFLATKRYTEEKLKEFYATLWPHGNEDERKAGTLSRAASKALEVVETQPGAEIAPGTWWNAFNSVTYAVDHVLGRDEDTRLTSAWYGHNRTRKVQALALAGQLAA